MGDFVWRKHNGHVPAAPLIDGKTGGRMTNRSTEIANVPGGGGSRGPLAFIHDPLHQMLE